MKPTLFIIAAACAALAACTKGTEVPNNTGLQTARVTLSFGNLAKDAIQTADEAKVSRIQVFVFKGDGLDAYKDASAVELKSGKIELTCTRGLRNIWVVANAPDLSSITSESALKERVTGMTEDNTADNFVMVGKADNEEITAIYSKTVDVDRIVSRIRLFSIKRDMSSSPLAQLPFEVTRVFLTNAVDNACYDIYTPVLPPETVLLNKVGDKIATANPFVYDPARTPAELTDGNVYGKPYGDSGDPATHTFYSYPDPEGRVKLVIEVKMDGKFYTYPVPIGITGANKTYDIKLVTLTKSGNPSDGDDEISAGENEDIEPAAATFSVTVNDWTPVLTFSGENGVVDGNITI